MVDDKSWMQEAKCRALSSGHSAGLGSAQMLPSEQCVCVHITCPDEVAYVVSDNDRAVAGMARTETLAAISLAGGAVGIECHTQHGRPALPVSIGLALLEEIWAQSASCHPEQPQSMRITALVTQLVHWLLQMLLQGWCRRYYRATTGPQSHR